MAGPLVFNLHGHEAIASALVRELGGEAGSLALRRFPDGECYVRLDTPVAGRDVIVLCSLDHPDSLFLSLHFLASTARELGASSVGLVAPYLAYMRQDKRFQEGEGVTSRYFARLLSAAFDWLVTVDPHLHRYHALSDVYSVPSRVIHAAPLLAGFIGGLKDAFLVGPDEESEQWVSDMAERSGLPWVVGSKQRLGDRQVEVTLPDLAHLSGLQPVLVDDVISSGMTMARALEALTAQGFTTSVCVGVHGLFAERADTMLEQLGARLVTTNTIAHASSSLDMGPALAQAVAELLP